MPYIPPGQRDTLDEAISTLGRLIEGLPPESRDGALNFAICRLFLRLYEVRDDPTYVKMNRGLGVISAAQHELYRRFVAPYEDLAIARNGDI